LILHLILSNEGGMKRVFNTRFQCPDYYVGVFSKKPFEESSHLFWIKDIFDVKIEDLGKVDLTEVHARISKLVNSLGIKIIICDVLTYPLIQHLQLPYIMDLHTLARPLYNAMNASENRAHTNSLLKFPEIIALEFLNYPYLHYENLYFKSCAGFISNSKNTTRYLESDYFSKDFRRPVFELPVASDLQEEPVEFTAGTQPTFATYIFSRWHPQKGFDNVLFENWSSHPLFIRGLESNRFKPEALETLNQNGIHFLNWTDDDTQLKKELLSAELVLFPSLYEPYGLALNEAMAMGCLCVAHRNNSGHEEQIKHNENGFLIDMTVKGWSSELKKIRALSSDEKNKIKKQAMRDSRKNINQRKEKSADFLKWVRDLADR